MSHSENTRNSHSINSRVASAAKLCTISCGGEFRVFYEVDSTEALCTVYNRHHGESIHVLGYGSNVLTCDEGLDHPVVKLGKQFRYAHFQNSLIRIGGSYPLMQLSREAARAGFSGLEFASGIPASLGGAVRMNAGAHGGEISQLVESIKLINNDAKIYTLNKNEIDFGYRCSSVPHDSCITEVTLRLSHGEASTITEKTRKFLDYRKATQPLQLPSCGSVFANPESQKAGELLEELGVKGLAIGGAQISSLHANWIVNSARTATAHDVFSLIRHCQLTAQKERSITLTPEVRLWGFNRLKSC